MNFESQFYKTADELVQAKDDAFSGISERRKRLNIIRKFSNGLATMTPEQAKELGRTEITNHLTTYSKLLQQESMFESMVTGTNSLVEIIVTTGDPEKDDILGQKIAKVINEGAIHYKGKFAAFWRKVSGEIVIAGGAPVVMPSVQGWLPKMALNMFFPKGTELDAEDMMGAFEPKGYSYSDLKKMLASVSGEKSNTYDVENIRALMKILKSQIKERHKQGSGFSEEEVSETVREDGGAKIAEIDAWSWYEVKFDDDGTQYVSRTIFTDAMQTATTADPDTGVKPLKDEDDASSARIICHIEKAYSDVHTWLKMIAVDSEIGGTKNVDTLRGVAELLYPSGTEMEELLNLIIQGDKQRALTKWRVTNGGKVDDILSWDIESNSMIPEGVEQVDLKSNTQQIQTPFSMLDRNSSSITGAPVSNSSQGGELRVQSQERQQSNTGVQTNRLSVAYNALDSILETVVWRLLDGEADKEAEGYLETMWVRDKLKELGIDPKKISERKHGRFRWIRVRAKRIIGNGDRQQQIETGDWLLTNLGNFAPATRPFAVQRAVALRTGDPDFAELLVRPPEIILNQQRVIAENEFDTIARRAMIGMSVSPQPDDINQNHIQTHMIDAQALLGENEIEPWKMKEVLIFAAIIQHIGEHIQILLGNKETNFEGNQFLQAYQTLIHNAKPAIAAVQKAQESSQNQLTPKEHADIEIQLAKLELDARALGVKEQDLQDLQRIRAQRSALTQRSQFVKEIDSSKRFQLEEKKIDEKAAPSEAS